VKTEQVNLRLEADLIAALEKAAGEEGLDRGTMTRKLLREALSQRVVERALQRYQRGEISIGRAAEEAGLTHWDLIALAATRGIAYPLSPEEAGARLRPLIGRPTRVAEPHRAYAAAERRSGPPMDALPDHPPARGGILLVGVNPAPAAVRTGHYYQGRLGKRLWQRLARLGLVPGGMPGREDEAFIAAGHGLTDLVKRPTPKAADVSREDLRKGVEALRAKVRSWSPGLILFAFQVAARVALGRPTISPGPCAPFEGIPTFLLSGPYANASERDRVDAELMEVLRASEPKGAHVTMTQPITPTDVVKGRIRLPRDAKRLFFVSRGKVDVVLRGRRLSATYDARHGPDKERSAVLRVGREALSRAVRARERLRVRVGADGLTHLD